ncbi:serine/threonine-protein kinase ULK3 isoform X5 [Takifugu flavidus]|uniref:serine/threonine-protein kinase ULK3 isoform X5 n=1 Tax=Takifugu flavidus TaxID=433684 RepID=UPI0025447C80|nr:serine/threonine-protein kinase ULK3 isoform X5 [Takifugu flavidus]
MASSPSFAPPKLADFLLTERLGSGTYATVYKAYRKGDSREVVAVKVVAKKTLNKASTENLLTEIEILKSIRHPHIVQLKDFQWDADNIYLILEWCSGGDLSRFIRSRRMLPEKVARRFLQQMACALQFLHERNISHLDLKPQNILLCGSVLKLAEALFGRAPFASKSFAELEEKIRSDQAVELPPGSRVSQDCRDLLLRLLERRPDARITFADFFSHPFVDLEHMPSADSLATAKKLVLRAVEEDQAGQWSAALSHYCSALEHFVPAIHYETEAQRKDALRQKVSQYVSRAEELKALLASHHRLSFEEARTSTGVLREMSRDQPRLLAALNMASAAIANEENGLIHEALDLYQQCLGELLLVLAAETQGRRRELLHREIKSLMNRAEYTKEQIKMQETQRDASLEPEPLADSVRSFCCVQ